MEMEVSQKVTDFSKPLIKKGYYPAQLLSVEPMLDKEGNIYESQYGNSIILKFRLFKEGECEEPVEVLDFENNSLFETEDRQGIIEMCLGHIGKNDDGTKRSNITPKSAITRTFEALGWKFDKSKKLNTSDFINNWVVVDIKEKIDNKGDKPKTYSAINEVLKYGGPEPEVGDKKKTVEEKSSSSLEQQFKDGKISQEEFAAEIEKLTKK